MEERAQELVGNLTRPYPLTTLTDAVAVAGERYLREGLTSVTEAGVGGGWIGQSPVELAAYVAAREQGRLPVRVELMVISDAFHPLAAHPSDGIEAGIDLGLRTGFGDDWLRLGPMKVFTDGSLVGRTAAMSAPYDGEPGNRGYLQADAGRLTAAIIAAHRAGWRVAAHAIGDRAIDLALDVFAAAAAGTRAATRGTGSSTSPPPARTRWRGRPPSGDPGRPGPVRHRARRRDARLGRPGPPPVAVPAAVRARRGHRAARQLRPAGGGRRPAARHHDMVNRRTASGAPFNTEEAVTAEEALRAYTWGSAYASKAEQVKGSIQAGKLADFTVLSEDPTAVSPGGIAGLAVIATIVDGQLRYSALS